MLAIVQAIQGHSRSFEIDHHEETALFAHVDFVMQSEIFNDKLFSILLHQCEVIFADLWSGLK